jgi:hypothetical protein
MNRHNVENYKMLTRVADFAASNVGLFPKSSAGLEIQTALASAVRELSDLSSVRISAETALRSGRKGRTIARDTLKGLLAQVNRTARALDSESFRSTGKPTDHTLIASALAFAADIAPMKKDFVVYGISPNDVTAAVRALEQALRDYSDGKAKRAAAVRELDEKLEVAMGYMRRFEALVGNYLADNSAVMAKWTVARSINRITTRKRSGKTTDVATPEQPKAA